MARIGRYEIEAEIGKGAMGVVHLAHDARLRRPVAVKTYRLPEGLSAELETEYHERFLREAQAAGGLSRREALSACLEDRRIRGRWAWSCLPSR